MRTYGKDANGNWQEITQKSYVWLATLIQNLRLVQGESPFYASAGIPAYQSVTTQIAPDIAVNAIQTQFSQYFSSLIITKVANSFPPTYNVAVVLLDGTPVQEIVS